MSVASSLFRCLAVPLFCKRGSDRISLALIVRCNVENIMFCTTKKDSELRLIDFGSGTLDGSEGSSESPQDGTDDVERHHTFAGSAFYISPEMFQRTYTSKTDVWSAAATLYVLVAGYVSSLS